jgi:predicted phosphodiesterase
LYFSGHSHLAVIQKVNNEDFVFSGHSHLAVIQKVCNEEKYKIFIVNLLNHSQG